MKLLYHNSLDSHYQSNSHTTCQILCSRVIYTIIAFFKTKQTTHKKKGKLESFQNNIYFHKLDFYLNKTRTIQSFIIHLTSYIHWLTNKDTRLSTSRRLVHWVRLKRCAPVIYHPSVPISSYFKPRIQSVPIRSYFKPRVQFPYA